jgi:hypothetical protein
LFGQPAKIMKNGIKEYFAIILALMIIPVYILFLIIQQLEDMLKETNARIDHTEKVKEKKTALRRFT